MEEPAVLCPECAQGKHQNCAGQALDPKTDEFVLCGCWQERPR